MSKGDYKHRGLGQGLDQKTLVALIKVTDLPDDAVAQINDILDKDAERDTEVKQDVEKSDGKRKH